MNKDDGPFHPTEVKIRRSMGDDSYVDRVTSPGASFRDVVAMHAMAALISRADSYVDSIFIRNIAVTAAQLADALIAELRK